jgi:hypothetical protein
LAVKEEHRVEKIHLTAFLLPKPHISKNAFIQRKIEKYEE